MLPCTFAKSENSNILPVLFCHILLPGSIEGAAVVIKVLLLFLVAKSYEVVKLSKGTIQRHVYSSRCGEGRGGGYTGGF